MGAGSALSGVRLVGSELAGGGAEVAASLCCDQRRSADWPVSSMSVVVFSAHMGVMVVVFIHGFSSYRVYA